MAGGPGARGPYLKPGCGRGPYLSEGLGHLPQEVLGQLDRLVHREVEAAVVDVLLDPAGQLPPLVRSGIALGGGGNIPVNPTLNKHFKHQHLPAASMNQWCKTVMSVMDYVCDVTNIFHHAVCTLEGEAVLLERLTFFDPKRYPFHFHKQ